MVMGCWGSSVMARTLGVLASGGMVAAEVGSAGQGGSCGRLGHASMCSRGMWVHMQVLGGRVCGVHACLDMCCAGA